MIRKSTLALACTAATLVGLASAPAQAATFNLQELIDTSGSFVVGDKSFSNFSCLIARGGAGITTPFSCSQINVSTLVKNNNPGLQFQSGFFSSAGTFIDVLLGYTATVLDPTQVIKSVELAFNGAATGDGFASVDETIREAGNAVPILAQASVDTTNIPASLSSVMTLTKPVKSIDVTKDIFLTGGTRGTARISFIDQLIVQRQEVPEANTVGGLLAVGSFGIGMMLKKRRSPSEALAFSPTANNPENN